MLQKAKQLVMGESSFPSQKGWDVDEVLTQLTLEEKVSLLSGRRITTARWLWSTEHSKYLRLFNRD